MAYTTINKGSSYFNTVLYTGNGGTQSVTGVGFQPDFVWIKDRVAADYHWWTDAIRGATKTLHSNVSTAETTQSTSLTAFGSSGFTLGSDASVNRNGDTFVSWNWLGANTTVSNTSGSITSTVSANPTSGFSIAKYTGNATNGATVGHGLGAAPDMIIGKDLSDTSGWGIWHKNLSGATYRLAFDTDAQSNDSALFGGSGAVLPTSTVFTLGSGGGLNGVNANIVYCFTSIKGYSKFGSYTGNGSTDGPFVYTGFKPAFVMFKNSTTAGTNWQINDSARDTFNVMNKRLAPSTSDAEATDYNFGDFLSNGFKIRQTDQTWNRSGDTYIYMCFASNPFVTSGGIPVTAR